MDGRAPAGAQPVLRCANAPLRKAGLAQGPDRLAISVMFRPCSETDSVVDSDPCCWLGRVVAGRWIGRKFGRWLTKCRIHLMDDRGGGRKAVGRIDIMRRSHIKQVSRLLPSNMVINVTR